MIKKSNKILGLMILIGLMSLLYATQADEGTHTVTPDTAGGIQKAIGDASDSDIIELTEGTYNGTGNHDIIVNKPVTIKAASNANPIINAEGQGRIFIITSNNVKLDGLTITGGLGNNNNGGGIYNTGANLSVSNSSFINDTSTDYGGAIYNNNEGVNFSVSNTRFINNRAHDDGGAIENYGANLSVSNSSFINNTAAGNVGYGGAIDVWAGVNVRVSNSSFINNTGNTGAIYNKNFNFSVIGCDIVGNIGDGIRNSGGNVTINYNRIVNNTNYGLNNAGAGINADCNWWGTNNISNAGIIGVVPNSYFVIQLSANDNYTRNNTTMSGSLPVPLTYNMVLNDTNSSENNSELPDFNTTIKLNDSINVSNAKEPWSTTLKDNIGKYNFTAICDNENLNINLTVGKGDTALTLNTIQNAVVGQDTNITGNLNSSNVGLSNKNVTVNITNTLGQINISVNCTTNSTGGFNYSFTPSYAGEYNVTANFDGDDDYNPSDIVNQTVTVDNPRYDLSLRNEPSGQVYVGTWINSIATAIGDTPLKDDYCIFKVTSPSGAIQPSGHKSFNGKVSDPYHWQLTEKGQYLVEVWAYDKDGNHVKVPDSTSKLFKPNVMKSFMEYSTSGDSISKVQSNALEVINVE
ncbi:MAG: hypothetical protein LBT10_06815 [Methanobrevibacter sp.]|jgi:hypothetical protein|nr:hypothetical protein [Methanobrevibacter sp.]